MKLFFTLLFLLPLSFLQAQPSSRVLPDSLMKPGPATLQKGLTGKTSGLNVQSVNQGVFDATRRKGCCYRSLSDRCEPALIVDGAILPLKTLADINPNDIISVEILKSAPAVALLGPEGAGGAIFLTTKKPKAVCEFLCIDAADRMAVARASLQVVDKMTKDTFRLMANDSGRCVLPAAIRNREYEIVATAVGYEPAGLSAFRLSRTGDTARLQLVMRRKVTACPEVVVTCMDCMRTIRCGYRVKVIRERSQPEPPQRKVDMLSAFPDPVVKGQPVTVTLPETTNASVLQVWSLSGQLLYSHPLAAARHQRSVALPTDSRWASGMYVLRFVEINGVVATGKLIVR